MEEKHVVRVVQGIRDGRKHTSYKLDGRDVSLYEVSRKLTGTTNESHDGIFTVRGNVDFRYGGRSKIFFFGRPLEFSNAHYYIKEIEERIKAVRNWVDSIDYSEFIEFTVWQRMR